MRLHTHFPSFEKGRATPGLILCLCGAFPAPLLWGDPACYRRSPRTEHLLIYRIQSHTNPKRRKGFLKQAGQKSAKEELPEQKKGPKRAVECWLKVQTHVWEQDAGSLSLPTWTDFVRKPYEMAVFLHLSLNFIGIYELRRCKMGVASVSEYVASLNEEQQRHICAFIEFMNTEYPQLTNKISFSMPIWLVGKKMNEGYVAVSAAKKPFLHPFFR